MYVFRIRYAIFGTLTILWLGIILPYIKQIIGLGPIVFPRPPVSKFEVLKLITISATLASSSFILGLIEIRKSELKTFKSKRRIVPLIMAFMISTPIVCAYFYEQDLQTLSQTILDLAALSEDFEDATPGEDPPGWEEESGNWTAVYDDGNMVYYQSYDGDREALTISTTGDISWTDYTFEVDVKFDEGQIIKPERGALLVYRYTGGNDYYFLAMREAQDMLEVYKHGTAGAGHLVGSTSCTLVQDTWYHVNITIIGNSAWISIDDTPYFIDLDMQGSQNSGSVGIGTEYYKVMFDNIHVELI